jgi:hypothetical protein
MDTNTKCYSNNCTEVLKTNNDYKTFIQMSTVVSEPGTP